MPVLKLRKSSAALTADEACRRLRDGPAPTAWGERWQYDDAVIAAHGQLAREAIDAVPAYPETFWGRGIVIPVGGAKYFTPAWVCASMLRHLGCELPIQFWHLGKDELDDRMRELAADLDVTCVDAEVLRSTRPARRLGGWELKAYAILNCRFREVILLDADNVPLVDPAALFDTPQYREHGAIFWPDYGIFKSSHRIWSICEVEPCEARQFESGQVVVDKRRSWAALNLAMHYNEHSDFYYAHIHGDKDTFQLAFRRLKKSFAMPEAPVFPLRGTMCQHDFEGRRIFQHRNFDKWRLDGANRRIPGFLHDDLCRRFIRRLRELYRGEDGPEERGDDAPATAEVKPLADGTRSVPATLGDTRTRPDTFGTPFKMFGLQRTCTNLVRRALLDNFEVESLEAGAEWKHGPIGDVVWQERGGQLPRIIVCVRNPYAWLVSCYAHFRKYFGGDAAVCPRFSPHHSFAEFVRAPHYDWPSPVERWNEMNRQWESFVAAHPLRAAIVRAEDLLDEAGQLRQWARLEEALGLARKPDCEGAPRPLAAFNRRVDVFSRVTGTEMDFGYFRKERYLAEFTRGLPSEVNLLKEVNARLDWELMGWFGYERREGVR